MISMTTAEAKQWIDRHERVTVHLMTGRLFLMSVAGPTASVAKADEYTEVVTLVAMHHDLSAYIEAKRTVRA